MGIMSVINEEFLRGELSKRMWDAIQPVLRRELGIIPHDPRGFPDILREAFAGDDLTPEIYAAKILRPLADDLDLFGHTTTYGHFGPVLQAAVDENRAILAEWNLEMAQWKAKNGSKA